MDKTTISWTQGDDGKRGATWNPTDGCEMCSPGCTNCYAQRMAGRFSGPGKPYEGLITIGKDKKARWNGEGRLNTRALTKPLRWRAPRRVFTNSMSDLFFERFTNEEIAAVFGIMAACGRHTFQTLTKRGKRAREWFEWAESTGNIHGEMHVACGEYIADAIGDDDAEYEEDDPAEVAAHRILDAEWPLPNAWIGVSVDDRKHGLPRIDELRDVPAAVRFLSCEPLLEDLGAIDLRGIHWVIAGCESGPGSRRCETDWLRSIRDQCARAGVAFFLKQAVRPKREEGLLLEESIVGIGPGSDVKGRGFGGDVIELPYLDGVQHRAFPEVPHAV